MMNSIEVDVCKWLEEPGVIRRITDENFNHFYVRCEKEGKNMKYDDLLQIYYDEEYGKLHCEEHDAIKELHESDELESLFNSILKEAGEKLKALYELNIKNFEPFDEDFDDVIGTDLMLNNNRLADKEKGIVEKYRCERDILRKKCDKIQAQINLIKSTNNDYNAIEKILIDNDIIENKKCNDCKCTVKRGRKPKKEEE